MDDATSDIIRKAMMQEASGIGGLGTHFPSPSPVQRWPFWSTDAAYLEDER